jgi:hypothetical protein
MMVRCVCVKGGGGGGGSIDPTHTHTHIHTYIHTQELYTLGLGTEYSTHLTRQEISSGNTRQTGRFQLHLYFSQTKRVRLISTSEAVTV